MQLQRARSRIEETGARLTLIGQATPPHARHFRRTMEIELPVLADERRVSYDAAGAKKGTIGELLGPVVVAKALVRIGRDGVMQGRTIGDFAQLGGTMIVMPGGRIAWSHMSEDASDLPTPDDIVAALRAL